MKEKDIQAKIETLSKMRQQILKDIKEYNKICKQIDFDSRLGMVEADIGLEDYEEEDKPKNIEKYVKEGYDTYVDIFSPGASGWFPSAICNG